MGTGRGRGLAWMLAGVPIGAACQLQQAQLAPAWAWWAALAASAVVAILMASSRRPRATWAGRAALLLVVASASFTLTGLRATHYARGALPAGLEGRTVLVQGRVAAMPQRVEGGLRFLFEPDASARAGRAVELQGPFLLGWYAWPDRGAAAPLPVLRAGERWRLSVRLRAPHGQLNPHGFDHELSLWEQGVRATGYVVGTGERLDAGGPGIERARQSVRDAILARIADPASAGIVAALVVGDQRAILRADWDVFRATGVSHLVSISGLHITLFAWLATAALGRLWRCSSRLCLAVPAQHAGLLGGVLLAAAYAVFSGWGVPAQRTVWMLLAVSLLRLSGRQWPWPLVWLLAMAAVVLVDPWALVQPGFWLSFAAVGVLFARGAEPGGRLLGLLREQAVVTVALAPLTLLLFGQVSLIGLPANLLAVPWVTLVVTPLGLAGVLVPPLWDLAAVAVEGLGWVLRALAEVPGAVWQAATPPLLLAAFAAGGALLLVLPLPPALRVLGLPLLLPVLLWQSPRPPPGTFELLAADVGQGSAVLVRTARHALLYDTGPRWGPESEAGSRVLVPLLQALGERLDIVVVSHRDVDHIGGAPAVLAAQPGARLWSSIEADHPVAALRRPTRCEAGQRWQWDGVEFEFLHPAAADYEAGRQRPNALSCVLIVTAGGRSALLTGDIELAQERQLLARAAQSRSPDKPAPLQADFLLVPHHGSQTSSSAVFIEAVRPRLALVQAGWRNRFGHPAPGVLQRLREAGVELRSTVECGGATWSSAAPDRIDCERERRRRYWHHVPAESPG
ncbi:DNA internalization-related competence protein ComEC/Rec2 [Ramlibacter rhizophilus]|uniref:DNA internalization-related competence protein ComEC/Rec2 n=1 Tax=Ramlibacter rhizophilus TaxID=1781167 RepID=A0A4Z0BJ32_9BURK|nr:DNA internalization-related competence protein ComEC/Rec2 [Ramlibacter rhizophilus]TFY98771.1 DNA internalization-related competence protein ComEC/Rec2 [Ramlibacter rhizophilus]